MSEHPLRVLRIAPRLPPKSGGKEQHVQALTDQQREQGLFVKLVYREGLTAHNGIDVHLTASNLANHLGSSATDLIWSFRYLLRVTRLSKGFDVIHVHGDVGLLPFVLASRSRRRVVTIHGSLNERWVWIYRLVHRRISLICCIGEVTAQQLRSVGVPSEKLKLTQSGVADCFLTAKPWSKPNEKTHTIVSVGSLTLQKNHEVIIRAILETPDPLNFRLLLAGEGPRRTFLTELAALRGINVEFKGQLSREEIAKLLQTSSTFVLPSLRLSSLGEGTSTALLEALAVGVPAVVSLEAIPTLIFDPDQTPFLLFDPRQPRDLASRLETLRTDHKLANQLSRMGQELARRYSWTAIAADTTDSYQPIAHE